MVKVLKSATLCLDWAAQSARNKALKVDCSDFHACWRKKKTEMVHSMPTKVFLTTVTIALSTQGWDTPTLHCQPKGETHPPSPNPN